MTAPFKPDFRHRNSDLPEGYNDLTEAARRVLIEQRLRLLHIQGQYRQHQEVIVTGNRNALTVLRDAIDAALAEGKASTAAMTSDGEGYEVQVELDDNSWRHPSWETRELPYSDPTARGKPDPLWRATMVEFALREANAALVKRGAKPISLP